MVNLLSSAFSRKHADLIDVSTPHITADIADLAITGAKIADDTIPSSKLSFDIETWAFSFHPNPGVTNAPIFHTLPFSVTTINGGANGGATLIEFTVPTGFKVRLQLLKSDSATFTTTYNHWLEDLGFLSWCRADQTPATLYLYKNDTQIASWSLSTSRTWLCESTNGYFEFVAGDTVKITITTPSGYGSYSYFVWKVIYV